MKFSRARALAVSSTALAALLVTPMPQALAQTLFDMLFKNNGQRRVQEMPAEAVPTRPVAPPRVSGPTYYTYKTDPLVKVDFAAIRPDRTDDAALLPQTGIDHSSVASTEPSREEAASDDVVQLAQAVREEIASDTVTAEEAGNAAATVTDEVPDLANELLEETPAGSEQATNTDPNAAASGDGVDLANSSAEEDAAVAAEAAAAEEPQADMQDAPAATSGSASVATAPDAADVDEDAGLANTPQEAAVEDAAAAEPPQTETPAAPVATAEPQPAPAEEEAVSAPQPLSDEQIASLQEFELLAEKDTAEAIVAHYTAAPEFIWVSDGAPNERARTALRTLAGAASHGLEPADYSVAVPAGATDAEIARFEMELSARMLRYVRDARNGRIDPNRISGYHDFEPKPLDQAATLQGAREAEDVAAFLEGQHPQNDRYRALRVELEALRASAENEIVIAPNTLIKPGQTNAEFPKVLALISQKADEGFRAEHGEVLTRHLGSEVYAQELVPVVKAAQRANGLGDDGVIGPRTVQALAGESKAGRIEKVEVALEQMRWLPSQFGDRYVMLNAAAADAVYVEDGREKLSMRTVVGGLGTQTYFFQDEIEYVEFHPYWGVPRSILVNKYLPKLYGDPGYLDRNGFEVVNSRGQQVSSSSVDWGAYGANIPFDVRQKPGGGNALGEMKIMFPNRHAIYMHDTPDKGLFSRDNRALSNGCVRLSDPRAMAAAVLGWSRGQVDQRVAGQHGRENLSVKVPVYVTYFTAWPSEAGQVAYHPDVYSRDEKVRAAIGKVEALRAPAG